MTMEAKAAPLQPPKVRRVLVIDPNEEHQVLSTMALSRRGFRVTVAGTGREAMRLAVTEPYDAIVIDVKIRDLPALDIVKALAQRMPDVPKIFVVSPGAEDMAVRALKEGAAGFLVKTPRYNELLPSEVESQLGRVQTQRDLRAKGRALGESEDRFAKTFRLSPVAISVTTVAEGRYIDVNDAYLAVFGFERDEVVGHTVAELRMWSVPEEREKLLQALRDRGSVRDMEFRFRHKSGKTLLGAVSGEMVDLEGGRCLLAIVRDVTYERRAETVRSAIYRISEAASTVRNLDELYPMIHVVVGELMPAPNLYIAVWEPGTDLLTFPYYVDEQDAPPPPAKMGHGLTEYVLRTSEPLLATPELFDDLVKRGEVDVVGALSVDWLGVPLIVRGRAIGVMAVQTYSEGVRYTEEDRDLLAFVSGQVAMAIERVRAEDSLRRAELRFRTMFTGAPVAIALMDLEGGLIDTNPACHFMLGYGPDELRRLSLQAIIHADDYPRNRQLFQELVEGGRTEFQIEMRFLRKDGSPVWGRVTASLLRDDAGKPIYVIGMVEDINRQKESEDKVRAADRRYRALIDNISDVVGLVDREGAIVYASPSTSRVLGYSPEELLGRSPMHLVDPADVERVSQLFARLAGTPRSSTVAEFRIRGKDGGYRLVEGIGTNLLDDPNVAAIVINFRDITERAQAVAEIHARARQQAAVAGLGQKALSGVDLPTLFNEAVGVVARTLDVTHSKILQLAPEGSSLRLQAGTGWKEGLVGHASVGAGSDSQAGFTLARKEPVIVEDLRTETRFHGPPLLRDHGIISGMSVIIPGPDGPFGVLGAHTTSLRRFSVDDVHFLEAVANVLATAIDRGRQERALAESQRDASMGQLAAYVAHEINTPLTNISLLVSGISRRTDDPQVREKLEKISAQRRQAGAIIADLLTLPRHRSLDRLPHDVRQLVANAAEQAQAYRKPEVELVLDIGDRPVVGTVDALQVQHVILNLIRNALEATATGTVTVRLREMNGQVILEVRDTGSGMTKEVLDQIFKPLFSTKPEGERSGLGLSFCRNVASGHGGTIEAVSVPGKGSTFTLTLPR